MKYIFLIFSIFFFGCTSGDGMYFNISNKDASELDPANENVFLDLKPLDNCIHFEYQVRRTRCHYKQDVLESFLSEQKTFLITAGRADSETCTFSMELYRKEGQICGLEEGPYTVKIDNLLEETIVLGE